MIKALFENCSVKILSLLIAVILWLFITGEQVAEIGFAIPLELKNIPKGLMVVNAVPSVVDVRFSGPRTILSGIRPGDFNLVVDLREARPGVTSFGRMENRIQIPSALKISRVSPSILDVRLEEVVEQVVPVRVVMNGVPSPDYRLAGAEARPRTVVIQGPRSEIRRVREVATETVNIAHLEENLSAHVPLNFGSGHVSLKEVRDVDVTITLEKVKKAGLEAGAGPTVDPQPSYKAAPRH